MHLRLLSLPPNTPRATSTSSPSTRLIIKPSADAPELVIPQLVAVRTLVNDALDVVDITRWTGSASDPSFISGQIKLLHDHLTEAKACLKGISSPDQRSKIAGIDWTTDSIDDRSCDPRLPGNLSLHFAIQDSNLVLTIRSLAPATPGGTPSTPSESAFSLSGFHLRNKLLGLGARLPNHDETGEVFEWRGKQDVIVREKARVETADPSLISVAAKLSALEHEVTRWRTSLRILMEESEDED